VPIAGPMSAGVSVGAAGEGVSKRDRVVVLGALAGISALAWAYLVYLAGGMEPGEMHAAMVRMRPWGPTDLFLLFLMWVVMMAAMMVPSAASVVLLFAAVNRARRRRSDPVVPTAIFLAGYLLAWTGYAALASLAQWRLHAAALLSPAMAGASPILGGALLLAAGVFQWMPLKQACLVHCRSPLEFLSTEWREGARGALRMGLRHGGYCVGCCWTLMTLLFVAGVMNLLWIATIAAFILAEKMLPRGDLMGRVIGGVLALAGIAFIASA
jgi:predicted metal-binding membrane protein